MSAMIREIVPPCRRDRHNSRSRALVERLVIHQTCQAIGGRLPLDPLEQPDIADRRADELAEQLDQRDVLAAEDVAGRLVGQVQHADDPLVADQRHNGAVGRLVVLRVGALGPPDDGLRVRVDVAGQDQALALDRHDHRRRRILTQRHDLVDGKRMIVLDQVQDAVGLIERVEGGESRPDHQRDLRDAHVGDAVDVEAIDLPRQWSHLLQQRDLRHLGRCVLIGSLAIVSHGPAVVLAPLTVVLHTSSSQGFYRPFPGVEFGKSRRPGTRPKSPIPHSPGRLDTTTEDTRTYRSLPRNAASGGPMSHRRLPSSCTVFSQKMRADH